jgi:hypothetical protein
MKKLLFISLIIAFLGSCQGEFDDINYSIINISSNTVSFSFYDISETTNLDKGESATYTVNSEKGIFVPEKISFIGHPRSILFKKFNYGTTGIFYIFYNNDPLVLNVHNTLPIDLDLFACDNLYFDIANFNLSDINNFNYISDEPNTVITIEKNGNKTAKIYTSTPFFIVKNGTQLYLADISWYLTNDTINVTIK